MKELAGYRIGDYLECDFGHGCHESWQWAQIIDLFQSDSLFEEEKKNCAKVQYGDIIIIVDI